MYKLGKSLLVIIIVEVKYMTCYILIGSAIENKKRKEILHTWVFVYVITAFVPVEFEGNTKIAQNEDRSSSKELGSISGAFQLQTE